MRARGAKVTDIVVIVVAADDGVMPQTLEAIDHASAAKVPIIVAVNKIDKPEAHPETRDAAARRSRPAGEAMGGDTEFVEVSAKKRINLDQLEEMICLVADVNEQKAQPDRPAVGTVIEAKLDRGRGAVASILVQNGTLRTGDSYIVGNTFGKVRAMFDDRGRAITEAGPSTPVEILGLEGMPDAGDTFLVMADRDKAKGIAQYRKMKEREAQLAKSSASRSKASPNRSSRPASRTSTSSSRATCRARSKSSPTRSSACPPRRFASASSTPASAPSPSPTSFSPLHRTRSSSASTCGPTARPPRSPSARTSRSACTRSSTSCRTRSPRPCTVCSSRSSRRTTPAAPKVLNVFKITKVGQIAGCRVTDGLIRRDQQVRLLREGEELWKGKIASLKRFKDDVSEVRQGVECGIDLAGFKDIRAGDIIESFTTETLAAELGQNSRRRSRKPKKAARKERRRSGRRGNRGKPSQRLIQPPSTRKGREQSRPLLLSRILAFALRVSLPTGVPCFPPSA